MENNVSLNTKEIFSFSFKKSKEYFWEFFVLMICFMVLSSIDPGGREGASMAFIRSVISFFGSIYLAVSSMGAILRMVDGQKIKIKDLFIWPKNGFKMIFTDIVSKLVILPFVILAIVTGIFMSITATSLVMGIVIIGVLVFSVYFLLRLSLSKYYALDTGSGVIESIKISYKATEGKVLKLLWLGVVGVFVGLLGLIALVVGLLWAIPTIMVAQVVIYRAFNKKISVNTMPEVQPLELSANPSVSDAVN